VPEDEIERLRGAEILNPVPCRRDPRSVGFEAT
jgi:hypothetical protein